MSEDVLVSVVMGVYNGADTIASAIQSILKQTHQKLELIICDDASTDDTWSLLQKWVQNDSRIRFS